MLKEDFLYYLTAERNYSATTVEDYNESLSLFITYIESQGRKLDWHTIEAGDIREWIVSIMNRGSAASTANTRLSALRSFYRYLLAHGEVTSDPTRRIQGPKKKHALPYFIKEDDINRLFDEIPYEETFTGIRDRLILLTFYSTGIRLSELTGLNLTDVDLSAKTLKVTGKRNKQRIIPFGEELEFIMKRYLSMRLNEENQAFFIKEKGERMDNHEVRNIVRATLGLVTTQQKRSPHILRHSFATAMLNHGAEIAVVKELLGHESLATTEIYTHTTFEELKKEYNRAHPRA